MDADVITIETSRSDMELLTAFGGFKYPNDIDPGVYDIHSPHISQLARERVNTVQDVVQEGDAIRVRVIDIEPSGRIKLSRKAIILEELGEDPIKVTS